MSKQSLNVNHLLLQLLSNCLTHFEDSLLPPAETNSCLQVLFLVKLHKSRVSTIELRSRCSSLLDIVVILGDVSLKLKLITPILYIYNLISPLEFLCHSFFLHVFSGFWHSTQIVMSKKLIHRWHLSPSCMISSSFLFVSLFTL